MSTDGTIANGFEDVEFPECEIDSLERGRSRFLYQFHNSCVMDQLLQALSCEVQELNDASCGVLTDRIHFNATGMQLDALGELIGQSRIVPDSGTPLSDFDYLNRIATKIYRNHLQFSSSTELRSYIKQITGKDVVFRKLAPYDLEILVPSDTTDEEILLMLLIVESTKTVESKYLTPIPASARLKGARRQDLTMNLFTPDVSSGRPDFAVASVTGFRIT